MIQSTIDSLEFTIKSCSNLFEKDRVLLENKVALERDLKEKEEYLEFLKGAKGKYVVALKYVMFDKNYSANLVMEDARGAKLLYITLVNDDTGLEVELDDGVGQGVRTIISFVLKSYYLLNQNSRVLFLDEKYSALSSHYVPRFYEFVKKFCEENDFIIVMISHIENQIEHADKVYYLNDGIISENTSAI